MKKWTAILELDGVEYPAEPSRWDTLRETSEAAIAEAAAFLRAEVADEARVFLYKRLKADPAPVLDRQTAFLFIEGGKVRVSR